MIKKNVTILAFTLIELLVVVAIIGILAAVGVVAYNGYTASAKAANTKSNHKLVASFIQSELKKCDMGHTNIMIDANISLVCNNLSIASVMDFAANSKHSFFSNLKNIYNPNSNQQYMTKGIRQHNTWVANLNWTDADVGTIWIAEKSSSEMHIRTCFKMPCSNVANRIETMVYLN